VADLCLGEVEGSNASGGYFTRGALAQPSTAAQDGLLHFSLCCSVVQVGAKRVVDLCLGEVEGSNCSGGYFARGALAQPSTAAQDAAKAAHCWHISCEATHTALDVYGGLSVKQ
jgi:hypothetical protein